MTGRKQEKTMPATIGFDIYGTLIDTDGVVEILQRFIGDGAGTLAKIWRDKQLEYAFRRGLMQNYRDFATCTSQALDYSCRVHDRPLSAVQKEELMTVYRTLPAFDDVRDGLTPLKERGNRW